MSSGGTASSSSSLLASLALRAWMRAPRLSRSRASRLRCQCPSARTCHGASLRCRTDARLNQLPTCNPRRGAERRAPPCGGAWREDAIPA
eukprot:scaffold1558_cov403-Prasinococcus_capsulatus_cf.AAC.27